VIDTNVFVSAMLSKHNDAATVQLVGRMLLGEIIPVYSREIMQEYREVLGRKKFKFEPERVTYVLQAVEKFGILAEYSPVDVSLPDIKDLPFYAVAMEKRDEETYLVTGNLKHFPSEKFVVTARQMLDILDGEES
jgi:putative PIN family toxin of toxin-antitoxin system